MANKTLAFEIGTEELPAFDLHAATLKLGGLMEEALSGTIAFDEAFLVSDEHGIVPASNASGPRSERFAEGYAKLLEKARMR